MDKIKENIFKDNVSKELLPKINQYLEKIPLPDILITSSEMTKSLLESGIEKLYKDKINFIHTLFCPYCYTSISDIDKAIMMAQDINNIIVIKENALYLTGSGSSLKDEQAKGSNIIVVNREIESLVVAKNNPDKEVIMFCCGFENTSPSLTGLILEAQMQNIFNLSLLVTNKLLPPAIKYLLSLPQKIDGYIIPGDLAIISGLSTWDFVTSTFKIPAVAGGFDSVSILYALESLLCMIATKEIRLDNKYSDLVNQTGNKLAQEKTYEVFTPKTVEWKGYGLIPFSGLEFAPEYASFDAQKKFKLPKISSTKKDCPCEEVLRYKITPHDCQLYHKTCTSNNPKAACMALNSGLCFIFHKTESKATIDISKYSKIID